ncbi:phage portal protein [Gilliamella sp. B3486]|uniref:phage portal protein n=1 Tax=unclassified Gilliamella TaxID=2685620 RepID=UPI002269EB41|nr:MULTISPECIES: phage portal protein [unclassified Gilliamella]MCX8596799.1 phage portal protein [Gilliamella sp. B3493]MCX8598528.1 phage portal protein [Gilliamella sp. B3486]MCX8704515.1 phage portal protein [Gilliamella sp. B3127]
MAKSFFQVIADSIRSPRNEILDTGGKTIRPSDSEFWANFFGWQSASGQNVSVKKSLKLSAVWSCVGLISDTVATLPLNLYERLPDGGRKIASDHSLQDILHNSPNYNNTPFEFWQIELAAMLLRGNAYAEIKRSANKVSSINFLLPQSITTKIQKDGSLEYQYSNQHETRIISENNMFHTRAFTLDGTTGISPIQYGANVIGSAMSADIAANSTFKNGLMPTIAFETDRVIKKEQREEFRESVQAISGAMNAGKSPILEYGLNAKQIGISPEDAQLLESRKFSIEEICRWFRVPPWMIGYTEKSTSWGTGLEQQMIAFVTFNLNPWITRIQQSINKRLLSPEERCKYYAEFSLDGLLKGDSSARSSFYSAMVNNGIYTRDEVRVKENLPKRGGNADVLTIQTAMAPIDALGKSEK